MKKSIIRDFTFKHLDTTTFIYPLNINTTNNNNNYNNNNSQASRDLI